MSVAIFQRNGLIDFYEISRSVWLGIGRYLFFIRLNGTGEGCPSVRFFFNFSTNFFYFIIFIIYNYITNYSPKFSPSYDKPLLCNIHFSNHNFFISFVPLICTCFLYPFQSIYVFHRISSRIFMNLWKSLNYHCEVI